MKTYYVPDMLEWIVAVRCGKARVVFHFSGGWMSAHGCAPATFSTDNPAAIAILEGSTYFKRGEIRLAAEVPSMDRPAVSTSPSASTTLETKPPSPQTRADDMPSLWTDAAAPESADSAPQNKVPNALTLRDVHVSCADDAKDYLAEHYGADRSAILTLYDLMDAARRRNLRFVFDKKNEKPFKTNNL